MKIKLAYLYAIYEAGTFFYEMKKRNATSIKLEFQKSVGKFNIYIDDSSFKTIEGKVGWQIIKTVYSVATKKAMSTFNKDESFDSDKEFTKESFNEVFNLKLMPLTKGRCLSYSYCKKQGGVYEAVIKIKSDNLTDYVSEKVLDLNDKLFDNTTYLCKNKKDGKDVFMSVESAVLKNGKIKIYLEHDCVDYSIVEELSKFETKSDVDAFFNNVKPLTF